MHSEKTSINYECLLRLAEVSVGKLVLLKEIALKQNKKLQKNYIPGRLSSAGFFAPLPNMLSICDIALATISAINCLCIKKDWNFALTVYEHTKHDVLPCTGKSGMQATPPLVSL